MPTDATTDAGNNLGRDAGIVAGNPCQLTREKSKHSRADADEEVRAQSSRTVFSFALQANQAAQERGQQKFLDVTFHHRYREHS